MKATTVLFVAAAFLCLTSAVLGQQALDEAQVQGILDQLTSQPRNTWISAGTIRGTHYQEGGPRVTDAATIQSEIEAAVQACQERIAEAPLPDNVQENPQKLELEATPFNVRYELENQYTMTTSETIQYDGQRFHWEITVTGRSDSIPLDSELQGNYMVRHYEEHKLWNEHRIFAWDGQEYTTYSVSGGQAIVDAAGKLPRQVHGPLTAGLIPWGYAKFSAVNLAAADVSASEITLGGTTYVQMAISHTDGSSTELMLDPSKEYAVASATLTRSGGLAVTYTCSGYQSVSDRWVPTSVAIEREGLSAKSSVATLERWTDITVTSSTAPSPSSFAVSVAPDAMVEYMSPITASSIMYINSYEADTSALLTERLACEAARTIQPQNCATVALQHVASEFGKSVSPSALANLVGPDGGTSLYDLKQAARTLGLYGTVVQTDLETLKNLGSAKAILYLPGKDHFVVLDRIDDRSVWLIDLSGKKFYYRENVHLFPMAWPTGTALVVSDRPVSNRLVELPDAAAEDIRGGYWLCNTLYQEFGIQICTFEPWTYCYGSFIYYYERWVCGCVDVGTCPNSAMVLRQESPCYQDPIVDCIVTGVWTIYYVRACQ